MWMAALYLADCYVRYICEWYFIDRHIGQTSEYPQFVRFPQETNGICPLLEFWFVVLICLELCLWWALTPTSVLDFSTVVGYWNQIWWMVGQPSQHGWVKCFTLLQFCEFLVHFGFASVKMSKHQSTKYFTKMFTKTQDAPKMPKVSPNTPIIPEDVAFVFEKLLWELYLSRFNLTYFWASESSHVLKSNLW